MPIPPELLNIPVNKLWKPCKRVGCGYIVTGINDEYCCHACRAGVHGPMCAHVSLGEAGPSFCALQSCTDGKKFGPFKLHHKGRNIVAFATVDANDSKTDFLRVDDKGHVSMFGKGGPFAQFTIFRMAPDIYSLQCVKNKKYLGTNLGYLQGSDEDFLWTLAPIELVDLEKACVELTNTSAITDDPSLQLSADQKKTFMEAGFVQLKGCVPQALVDRALCEINSRLCEIDSATKNEDGHIQFCSSVSGSPAVLALFYMSPLYSYVQSLLGRGKVSRCHGGQIALRGPNTKHYGLKEDNSFGWHLDGIDKNKHSPFSLLVGVTLSPATEPNQGNLVVYPGSHKVLLPIVKDLWEKHGVTLSRETRPDLGRGTQVMASPGDVVLVHHKVAHEGGLNASCNIRYQVYFRVSHINHGMFAASEQTLNDLWVEFEGLSRVS
eukprot:TRINITY_DN3160_c0_g1_i1.p1 TRINITY_DN3160_c0_g1~~TRINITY_DN3160_c0_g1_i1.p1  ORF type:complete len:436 (+),score=40.10 TRINITY_DN3160_c0_g1_i1:51-1358(+)